MTINIIVTIYHTIVFVHKIDYIYIFWNTFDAIHRYCIHKLNINGSCYKMDQNTTIGYILNKIIPIVCMTIHYHEFPSNTHKIDQCHQMGNKMQNFQYNGYIGMILSLIDARYSISYHKLYTNGNGCYELNRNGNIQCTLDGTTTTMFATIQYDKSAKNMCKRQIDNKMNNLNPIIPIIKAIDTIKHQSTILLAIYVITFETLLFTFTHDQSFKQQKFMHIVFDNQY